MTIEKEQSKSEVSGYSRDEHNRFTRVLVKWYSIFLVGFVIFCALMALAEALGLPKEFVGYGFLLLTIGLYAGVGIATRTGALDEYYVAGRRVPAIFNGMATGADWMSGASFVSMAGTLYALGYEGLAYIMGWTGGYVLLALLLAPYIRKFGAYTIPDFVAQRYEGNLPRVVGAICAILVSFTYVTAQVVAVGLIMSRFLGIDYFIGVVVGLSAVLLCSFLGGMKAVTWTQVAQYIILIVAYLLPVTFLAINLTGNPIPQFAYGNAAGVFEGAQGLEAQKGITAAAAYFKPYNNWSMAQFICLLMCLMFGTAGLPHILIRFYTVPSVRQARKSVGWALFFIFLLYFTAPAYATLARWKVLQDVVGQPVSVVQQLGWFQSWNKVSDGRLLAIRDTNNDGIVQLPDLVLNTDLIVLATPEIAGLPYWIVALVAAGGLAAALSTADGLLVVISSAFSHDIYYKTLNPTASNALRLKLGKGGILVAAALAALLALPQAALVADTVAWAFGLAASSFFPILVLGIFWKRCNRAGAVTGMIAGISTTLFLILSFRFGPSIVGFDAKPPTTPAVTQWLGDVVQIRRTVQGADIYGQIEVFGVNSVGIGVVGMTVNFLCCIFVSLATKPPKPETQEMVEKMRRPTLVGEDNLGADVKVA
jgi:cation/acetate symporter